MPSDAVGDLDMGELSFKPSTKDLWDAETHHFELIGVPNNRVRTVIIFFHASVSVTIDYALLE